MAVVYLHRRKDTNEVFYVGVGKTIARSKSKSSRNPHWHHIVNKFGYTIQVIQKKLTWQQACKEEIRLIKFYGRKDLNLGTLVNMTDGGEGTINKIITDETRKKMGDNRRGKYLGVPKTKSFREHLSKIYKNRTFSEETRKKMSLAKKHYKPTDEQKLKNSLSNRGENNASCKLTKEKVIWLRENEGNYSVNRISKEWSMTRTSIYNILKRKTWKHI